MRLIDRQFGKSLAIINRWVLIQILQSILIISMRHQLKEDQMNESLVYQSAVKRIRAKLGLNNNYKEVSQEHQPTTNDQSVKLEQNLAKNSNSVSKSNSNHCIKACQKTVVLINDSQKDTNRPKMICIKKERQEQQESQAKEINDDVRDAGEEQESFIHSLDVLNQGEVHANLQRPAVQNQQESVKEILNIRKGQRIESSQVNSCNRRDSTISSVKEEEIQIDDNSFTQPIIITDSPIHNIHKSSIDPKTQTFKQNQTKKCSQVKLSASYARNSQNIYSSDPVLIAHIIKLKVEEYMRQRTVFSRGKGEIMEEKKLYKIFEKEVSLIGQRRSGKHIQYKWIVGPSTIWAQFNPFSAILLDLFLQEFNNLTLMRCRYSGDPGKRKNLYKDRRFLEKMESQLVLVQAQKLIKFYANPNTANHWQPPEEIVVDLVEKVDEKSLVEKLDEIKNAIRRAEKALEELQEDNRRESISRLTFMHGLRERE